MMGSGKSIKTRRMWSDEQGKGTMGCVVSLALLGIMAYIVIRSGPDYYAFKSFDADVRTAISRAGANFYDDETVLRDVLDLARRNEVRVARENIKIERFAGQLHVTIHHTIPLDLIITQHKMNFEIKASSYVGRL